jgi:uncharacterized membrane protein
MAEQGKFLSIFFVFSVIGLLDSIYLFYERVTGGILKCVVFEGCQTVANSSYSAILGVPLSLLGIIFYSVSVLLGVYFSKKNSSMSLLVLQIWSVIGFVDSMYFVFVQGVFIKAFCVYCLLSAFSATTILCTAILLKRRDFDLEIN